MTASEPHVKNILVNLFDKLKIFGNENDFNKSLDEIIAFIRVNHIPPEILGEVLAAFIIERCDNILANTAPTDNNNYSIRENIHRLAAEALKLYLHSLTRRAFLEDNNFVKYILELKNLKIEANTREDLQKRLLEEANTHVKKVLEENAEKLAETIIVDSADTLENLLPTIRKALESKTIKLLIVPSTVTDHIPLFFKNYYISHNDREKVKRIIIAIDRIIHSLKPFFKSSTYMCNTIEALEKTVRSILGAEPLDEFIQQKYSEKEENSTPTETTSHEDYKEMVTYIEALEVAKLKPVIHKVLKINEHTIQYKNMLMNMKLYKTKDRTYIIVKVEGKKPVKIRLGKPDRTARKLINVLRRISKT